MKASKKTIAALAATATLLLTQCAPKVAKTVEAPSKTASVASSASEADIQEGQKIFVSSCGRCHSLKQPETQTTAQWEKIIPNMAKKAKLDEHQTALVYAYVMKGAKS